MSLHSQATAQEALNLSARYIGGLFISGLPVAAIISLPITAASSLIGSLIKAIGSIKISGQKLIVPLFALISMDRQLDSTSLSFPLHKLFPKYVKQNIMHTILSQIPFNMLAYTLPLPTHGSTKLINQLPLSFDGLIIQPHHF